MTSYPIPTTVPVTPTALVLPSREPARDPWAHLPTYAVCRRVHVAADHTATCASDGAHHDRENGD